MKFFLFFSIALFFALPARASCPTDAELFKWPNTEKAFEAIINYYRMSYENFEGNIKDKTVTTREIISKIQEKRLTDCRQERFQFWLVQLIRQSTARYPGSDFLNMHYHDKNTPPKYASTRNTVAISVFLETSSQPFITDYYRWNGQRFQYILTEKFES